MGGMCSSQKHQTKYKSVATRDYNLSSKGSMKYIDSAKGDSENSSVLLMISDPKMLDCYICFQPLSIPVYQCDNGHIVCSTCCPKFIRNKCHKCSLPINSKRCKAIEKFLMSIEMSCPNAKHGCTEKINYIGNRNHEEECIYETCYCPLSSCDFVASSKVLYNHFSHKHADSRIKFSYGCSFFVFLKPNDETFVLQEENDGKLFVLSNRTMDLGNAVNICCIGSNFSEFDYSYDILIKSEICTLKLQSFAKNIQEFTSTTLSSESLVIPFDSFEPLKIEICIISSMMQIYVNSGGTTFPLMVNYSDTIINVKRKIFDKKGYRVQEQRLISGDCKQELEDNLTLANYNTKYIRLALRSVRS